MMDNATREELEEIQAQTAAAAAGLHRLLGREQRPGDVQTTGDTSPEPRQRATAPIKGSDHRETDRNDRVAYAASMRRSMYRALYAVDFTLVNGRIDRLMLRDARQALVNGIDAADAHLMIDGALTLQAADEADDEE